MNCILTQFTIIATLTPFVPDANRSRYFVHFCMYDFFSGRRGRISEVGTISCHILFCYQRQLCNNRGIYLCQRRITFWYSSTRCHSAAIAVMLGHGFKNQNFCVEQVTNWNQWEFLCPTKGVRAGFIPCTFTFVRLYDTQTDALRLSGKKEPPITETDDRTNIL